MYENTEVDFLEEDEEDKDQNEEELENLKPKIELDVTAVQDREDDPAFEDNEAKDKAKPDADISQYLNSEEDQNDDEILKLL